MLQSDAASALLATINESANTSRNEFVYSETSNVVPYQSVQWDNISPASLPNVITGGNTVHFDVSKMGILTKAVLGLTFTVKSSVATGTARGHLCPNAFLNCINEVVLTSGGRTISRLTQAGIMARMSEKTEDVKLGYVDATQMDSSAKAFIPSGIAADTDVEHPFLLNLDFFFQENKYALQTNFLQPIRLSVSFNTISNVALATTTTVGIMTSGGVGLQGSKEPTLYVQYRNLADPVDQATIQANYADGLLTQVVENMSYENPLTLVPAPGAVNTAVDYIFPLKDTSCIECIYLMVMVNPEDNTNTSVTQTGTCCPAELQGNIIFRSNGTNFIDIPAKLLKTYGIQSQQGRNAFGSSKYSTQADGNLQNIYCIDFTSGMVDSTIISNLLSLRELSNPEIRFRYSPTTDNASKSTTAYVSYCRRELASTISNTGRYSISLSN